MESKVHKNYTNILQSNQKGYSLAELIIVTVLVLLLVSTIAFVLLLSREFFARGRDNRRLSDMVLLETAINEYHLDNDIYPDLVDTTRQSDILPTGSTGPLHNPSDGWFDVDLSPYMRTLPLDPKNEGNYVYTYRHNGTHYELNCVLEYQEDIMLSDGGNDSTVYETGSDLSIL